MATQDKALLMHKVEDTLRPRMFANLLDEAIEEINGHLDEFDVRHVAASEDVVGSEDMLTAYIIAKRVEGRTEKTLVRYQYIIERFMKAVGVKTRDVTAYHIRNYITQEQERGISDRTLNGIRQVLSSYFEWLTHERMVPVNPVFNVGNIKYEKKVREAIPDADIEKLKRACTNMRDYAIINFLNSTGCRVSEVTGLNRNDIKFDDKGCTECIVFGKGRKERTVYLDEVATMTLREYLLSRCDDNEALFVNRLGERLTNNGVRAMLNNVADRAGVEHIHPHRFRRTLITKLLNRGMAIQEVAILAGHDKVDTTMNYYNSNNSRIKSSYQRYYS